MTHRSPRVLGKRLSGNLAHDADDYGVWQEDEMMDACNRHLADLHREFPRRRYPTLYIAREGLPLLGATRASVFSPIGSPAGMCAGN